VKPALVVGGLLSTWTIDAHAGIDPFRGYSGPRLSKEDIASGRAAAEKLLTEDQAQVGRSENWLGPTSGNTGTISVLHDFQKRGMKCRQLRSQVHYKTAPHAPRSLDFGVCRISTGEWKLL